MKKHTLGLEEAQSILKDVLERCEFEQNQIPLDTFVSYSNYRKEKYAFQKRILVIIIIVFIILPFGLLTLTTNITKKESQYLSLYRLNVENYFPIKDIQATINGDVMPVFEQSDQSYVIKATKNGELHVVVTLWNRQQKEESLTVSDCDETTPVILDYNKDDRFLYLHVDDLETGINYKGIYIVDENDTRSYPDTYDESLKLITIPATPCEVYIPDYAGNKLHINLK